jgi:hypothetical protein
MLDGILRPNESQQVLIYSVLLGGAEAMGSAGVCQELSVFDQLDREQSGVSCRALGRHKSVA